MTEAAQCNERPAALIAGPGAARRGLAALRPLHGAGAVRAGPGLLRQRLAQVRPHAVLGQRLRHGAGDDAAVRPRAGARRWREALQVTGTREVWEFGAGSGALAAAVAARRWATGSQRYTIVDLSASLRERQQHALAAHGAKVQWVAELPERMQGVVVGNEVLDAMPVKLLAPHAGRVARARRGRRTVDGFAFARPAHRAAAADGHRRHARLPDRDPSAGRRPSCARWPTGCSAGAAFFIDYGFPEARVLPPAAPHGHADVPSRPPGRSRSAGGRRARRTSPRTSTSPASRWRRRKPGCTCWATPARRAS